MKFRKFSIFSIILSVCLFFSTTASSFDVSKTKTWFNSSDEQTRKAFQQFFKTLGTKITNYNGYQGTIDGVWGKGTENAINQLVACFKANGVNINSEEEVNQAFGKLTKDISTNSRELITCPKVQTSSNSKNNTSNSKFGYKYKGYLVPTKLEKCWQEPFKTEFCEGDTGVTRKLPIEIVFKSIVDSKGKWSEEGALYITIKGKTVLFDSFKMFNRMSTDFTDYYEICPPSDGGGLDYWCSYKFGDLKFSNESFSSANGKIYTKLWPKPYGQVDSAIKFYIDYAEPQKLSGLALDNFYAILAGIENWLVKNDFNPNDIKVLQNSLKDAGFYNGQIDGQWGLTTSKATALALTSNLGKLPNGPAVTLANINFLTSSEFREIYDKDFAEAEKLRKAEESKRDQEKRAAERKKQLEAAEKRRKNRKLAEEDLNKKLNVFEKKLRSEVNSNFGFRSLIPSMEMQAVMEECGYALNNKNAVNCFDIENIGFLGEYRLTSLKSETFGQQSVYKNISTLSILTLDLGPISQSWASFLPSGSKDINDGDILQKMRNNLSKYDLEFEYSQRDIELFNAREKDSLIIVYEEGRVVLRIQRLSKDYSSEKRLFLEYRDAEEAKQYLEENIPKKATSDDF